VDLYEGTNWAARGLILAGAALTFASTKVRGKKGVGVIFLGCALVFAGLLWEQLG
jgi:Na+/phosphate symporter